MATVQSIQFNVGVFAAVNNVRRSAASFSTAYQTTDGALNNLSLTLQPGATYSFTPPIQPSSAMVLRSDAPLILDVNVPSTTVAGVVLPSAAYRQGCNGLYLLDSTFSSIVLTNPNTFAVTFTIVQG